MALVAEHALEWRPELIGVARYDASNEENVADIAIVVQDHWQGRGLGSILLNELLGAGEANGIRRFRAHVLADNRRTLAMLSRLTDIEERRRDGPAIILVLTRPQRASQPKGGDGV